MPEEGGLQTQSLDAAAWRSLAFGFVFAAVCCCFELPRFIFSYLAILIHELGHSATAWLFGYLSIPSFNFQYGGGVAFTWLDSRSYWPMAVAGALLLFLAWRNRRSPNALALLAFVGALYGLLCVTDLHKPLMVFMGHGSELLFSGVFLYRAISGRSIEIPLERPLYAFAGFFLQLNAALFAFKLLRDPVERIMYEEGMATGGNANDFVIIAEEHFRQFGVSSIAGFFLALCALPPLCAFLLHRYREWIFK